MAGGAEVAGRPDRPLMRRHTAGVALAVLLACPASAGAVSDLRVTEHIVPATASTGQLVEARVTVTNVGDTATESKTEIEWLATNDEGFIVSEFEPSRAVCPPGSEDMGEARNLCLIGAPIAPGASVTAVFSGSSRFALELEARASVRDWGTGVSTTDTKPLTISGPTIPLPLAPRITSLTLDSTLLRPRQRARLRYRLERRAQKVFAMLLRCTGRSGCRRARFVLNSVVAAPGRRGRNTLRYALPAGLEPGRYRITLWTEERGHRRHSRSVTFRLAR
jgi:hypothetical protein